MGAEDKRAKRKRINLFFAWAKKGRKLSQRGEKEKKMKRGEEAEKMQSGQAL